MVEGVSYGKNQQRASVGVIMTVISLACGVNL